MNKESYDVHKFSYTHRGLLDRRSANIGFDLEFGDEVRVTRNKLKPVEEELRGLMGVFTSYTPKGYALIMLQDTRHPFAIDGKVSVHPESLIWLRHRGQQFDAYTDESDVR